MLVGESEGQTPTHVISGYRFFSASLTVTGMKDATLCVCVFYWPPCSIYERSAQVRMDYHAPDDGIELFSKLQ